MLRTDIGSTFFGRKSIFRADTVVYIRWTKFRIDRVPSCPILEMLNFGHIMAVGQWSVVAQKINLIVFHNRQEISDR